MASDQTMTFYQSDLQAGSFVAFENMRKREELCDLTITAGSNSISAHKVILAAGIPYFRALFTSQSLESGDLGNLDPGALESLINFAYTSSVTISDANVQSLLVAAEFLELHQVKDACVEFLSNKLSGNNVVQVRTLALRLNISKLLEKSNNYIRQNFESFSKNEDFLNLSHSYLKDIISNDDLNVSREKTVFEAVMKWVKVWPSERRAKLPELLSEVRMVFLPAEYLIKNVSSEQLIRNSLECRDLIQNVQSYHLLSKQESAFLNLKTQPRKWKITRNAVYSICSPSMEVYSIYCFDFLNEIWTKLSSREMQEDSFHCIAVTGGDVYVFLQNTIHMFDVQAHVWKVLEPTHEHINGAAVLSHGSNIYCFGGSGGGYGDRVRRFDTRKKKWLPEGRMTRRRSYCSAVSLGDGIYVTGGLYYADEILDTVERYNPWDEEWSECPPMMTARYLHGGACINSYIYVCGGMTGSGPSRSAEVYDPTVDLWCPVSSMKTERRCFSLLAYNNKIYALGGVRSDGKSSLDSEIYDLKTKKWKSGFKVPEGFHYAVGIAI